MSTYEGLSGSDDFQPMGSTSAGRHVDVAAYALGALEPHDAEAYEWHLLGCTRCKADLQDFLRLLPQLDVLADELCGPKRAIEGPGHTRAIGNPPSEPPAP